MADLDRRSMLKLLLVPVATGVSVVAIVDSCSRGQEIVLPIESSQIDGVAEATAPSDPLSMLVRSIVLADFQGARLRTCPPRMFGGFLVDAGYSGWDVLGVAHGFDVSPPTAGVRGPLVNVTFQMIGRAATNGFSPVTDAVTHPYQFIESNGQRCVVYGHEPVVSRSVAVTHLRGLLEQPFKIDAGRATIRHIIDEVTVAP